ncbi:MAG: nitroreductase family protein [Planctomycetota bacterium]
MNVIEAIKNRRAVKHFDANFEIPDGDLRKLMSAGALAPTSFNMQNRQFVAVTDAAVKAKLKAASWNQEHVGDASVVIVVAGNFKAHQTPKKFLRTAPEKVREMFTPMIGQFYEGKDELIRDEACRSVGMAAMNLMLAAQDLGYESCPLIGFDPQQVAEIVGLSAEMPPLMLVTVGKGIEAAWPRLGLYNLEEIVSINKFDNRAMEGSAEG